MTERSAQNRSARNRSARNSGALGLAALGAAALTYVGLVDPHRPGAIFPACPFKALTGWNCPGCGGLRMTHDLLHGDIAAAVTDNVFLLVGLPTLMLWVWWQRSRGGRTFSPVAAAVIAIAAVVWTVVRNLPGFPLIPTSLNR